MGNARARFSPNGTSAALYVDMLEFQGDFAEKWESNLTVDSNFTIYFGGSNLPVEELDGALGGRFAMGAPATLDHVRELPTHAPMAPWRE